MTQIKILVIIFGLVILSLPILVFFPNEGSSDMRVWLDWTESINKWGPLNAYSIINTNHDYERSDYPPISFVNLWIALKVAAARNVNWVMGIKIIILGYYLATWAGLIYFANLFKRGQVWTNIIVASGLFLGSLFFVVNSEALSYLDITYAPWIVLSLAFLARRKYLLSGMFIGVAILVKWLPVVMLPAFLFYFISKKGRGFSVDYFPMLKFFLGITLVFSLLIAVFLVNHVTLLSLVESLDKAFSHGSTLSPGGLNFNWIVAYIFKLLYPSAYVSVISNNILILQLISAVIFLLVSFVVLKRFLETKNGIGSLLQASLMISWSYFIWRTGVHENHLFISVLTALCICLVNYKRENIKQYLWLSFFGLANFVILFGFPVNNGFIAIPDDFMVIFGIPLFGLVAAFHVLIYLVYLRQYLNEQTIKN